MHEENAKKAAEEANALAGNASFDRKSTLKLATKKSVSPSKTKSSLKTKTAIGGNKKNVGMKREFANLGPPLAGLGKDFLFSRIREMAPNEEIRELLSQTQLQYFLTHSKMLVLSNGNSRVIVAQDILRWQRVIFVEFLVFICFVANLSYSLVLVNGYEMPFFERFKRYVEEFLLPNFGEEWIDSELKEGETEKVVGLDRIDQILLQGKVQKFVAPTPVSQIQSYYPDMFSQRDPKDTFMFK